MTLGLLRNAGFLLIVLKSVLSAAVLTDSVQNGKDYYFAGEFKKAISQFEVATKLNPDDPEPYLWLGKTYTLVADLKPPLMGARSRMKARMYLLKAVSLAPDCAECRRELFDLLVGSDDSPSSLREASLLVANMSESNPDYDSMKSILEQARSQSSSPEYLLATFFKRPSESLARVGTGHTTLSAEERKVRLHHRASAKANKRVPQGWERASLSSDGEINEFPD